MSLECYRTRLRAIEDAARKRAASAECSGVNEPVLIQIGVRFHPADRCSMPSPPKSARAGTRHRVENLDPRAG